MPIEEERWAEFNRKLAQLIPNPPANWREKAKPCKYQAILDERKAKKTLE
jgi:hypothetical protein